LSGSKLRPSVVLAETSLDSTVCFITTQIKWQEPTDLLLTPGPSNGLKKSSIVRTSKIATLDKTLIKGLMGSLTHKELIGLNQNLKALLQLA